MSKIDEYNEISLLNSAAIGGFNHALGNDTDGKPDRRNDKNTIRFGANSIWDSDIKLFCHMSYGYYGNSSGYSVDGKTVENYLLEALNCCSSSIVKKAIELAQRDIDDAREKCRDEATQILNALNKEANHD